MLTEELVTKLNQRWQTLNGLKSPEQLWRWDVGIRIMKMNELRHKFNGWMRKILSANIIYVLVLHEIFMLSFTFSQKLFIVW